MLSDHPVIDWAVRQQLFPHRGTEDGKTTFFRDQQRHYERHMLPLGETAMWRDRNGYNCKFASRGCPEFGSSKKQRGYACELTRQRAVLARAIEMLPLLERHGTQVFLALRGTPWLMRTGKHEEDVEDREHSNHQRDRSSQRARAMHNEGYHPRRNTRREQRRNYLRF